MIWCSGSSEDGGASLSQLPSGLTRTMSERPSRPLSIFAGVIQISPLAGSRIERLPPEVVVIR